MASAGAAEQDFHTSFWSSRRITMTTAIRCNGAARSSRRTRSPACTASPRIASDRKVLGADVEIRIHAIDETNWRVRPDKLIKTIRDDGGRGMLGLVGVQSNQFPRALDIARPFLKAGVPVCMGGFHVAGSLAMLDETPPEIAAAADMGISYFIGEAEDGRLDEVLIDAYAGKLKPRYDWRRQEPEPAGHADPVPAARAGRPHLRHLWQLRPRPRLPVPVLVLHHHQRAGPRQPLPLGRRPRADRARQPRDRRQPLLPDRRQSRAQPQLGSPASTG